jgi:DNA (cytosine-5)-methyltransferase 1
MGALTVGSLFSGIGGFDLGFERAGMRTEWFVEQDAYCQRVLATHWPSVPIIADVCSAHAIRACPFGGGCPDCLCDIDVLCGGFPCQDLSLAGKGAGITGARSGLWSEYARLIGELGPRWVVVENVPALKSRGLGRVLADLAALGYDAEWDCIPASAVGAPHQRDRIWLVAYPQPAACGPAAHGAEVPDLGSDADRERRREHSQLNGGTPQGAADRRAFRPHSDGLRAALADAGSVGRLGRPGEQGAGGDSALGGEAGDHAGDGGGARGAGALPDAYGERQQGAVAEPQARGVAEPRGADHVADAEVVALGAGLRPDEPAEERWGRSGHGGSPDGWWAIEPDVGRVADGVPDRVDRLRSLGNALVPQVAEAVGRRIVAFEEAQR